jgi:hypothetical protein
VVTNTSEEVTAFILRREAQIEANSSEILVTTHNTRWYHNPEDLILDVCEK